jgi:hypothetical protein
MNGRFSISCTDTLIASFIGYESKIISANKLKQYAENTILLKTEALSASEVFPPLIACIKMTLKQVAKRQKAQVHIFSLRFNE